MRIQHASLSGDDGENEVVDLALELFKSQGIHLHSNYDELLIVLDGGVVAAAAMSMNDRDDPPSIEFSLATAPGAHRRGYGRALMGEVIAHARALAREFGWREVDVEGYVVNPVAIIPLLTPMGFRPDAREPQRWRLNLGA